MLDISDNLVEFNGDRISIEYVFDLYNKRLERYRIEIVDKNNIIARTKQHLIYINSLIDNDFVKSHLNLLIMGLDNNRAGDE